MSGNPLTSPPPVTPSSTASALLRAGLTVTSTSTPALNGTYSTQGMIGAAFQAEANALAAGGTFADGTATLNWPDIHNVTHAFNETQFRSLVTVLSNFVSLCTLYAMGIVATPPAATATIP